MKPSNKKHFNKWLLLWLIPLVIILGISFMGISMWLASNQLLFPSFRGITKNFSVCNPETVKYFGRDCGNLRESNEFKFSEVKVASVNGYDLPGWFIKSSENGFGAAQGAVFLVPAGGSDRREDTKYIKYFLSRHLDVLTYDPGCAGEAPCPVPGLSYGERESRDVFSVYLYLTKNYSKVYAMGSSVGASSILIALPQMPKLAAVIAENPMISMQRLIKEAPEAKGAPEGMLDFMINLAMTRGKFDGLVSPESSLKLTSATPIFFVHSKEDRIVSYKQTQELYDLYSGPKSVWIADRGEHAAIWNTDHVLYEQRLTNFLNNIK